MRYVTALTALAITSSPVIAEDSPSPGWYHHQSTATVAPGEAVHEVVRCPLGTRIIAGAYSISATPGTYEVDNSSPVFGRPQGWHVSAHNSATYASAISIDVVAHCTNFVEPVAAAQPASTKQTCPDGSLIDVTESCPPPRATKQTCPDGGLIDTTQSCPTVAPPRPEVQPVSMQTCPDGDVIDATQSCPSLTPPPSDVQPVAIQTCPDGGLIVATQTCPPAALPPAVVQSASMQACPDGGLIDAAATCPPAPPGKLMCPDGRLINTMETCPPLAAPPPPPPVKRA